MEVSPAPLSPAYKPMSITGTPLASAELDKAFSLGPALHEPTETTFVPQEPIDAGQISRVCVQSFPLADSFAAHTPDVQRAAEPPHRLPYAGGGGQSDLPFPPFFPAESR